MKAIAKKEKLLKDMGKTQTGKIVKPLSPKEVQVYELYFRQKMERKEIAKQMGVDYSRVSHILQNIRKKMEIDKENEPKYITKEENEPVKWTFKALMDIGGHDDTKDDKEHVFLGGMPKFKHPTT